MARPLTMKPTKRGAPLRAYCIEHHGSIEATARAAGVPGSQLRKRIYTDGRTDEVTMRKLRAFFPRKLIDP